MYSVEEFDREKTKILKYIMYKKRTENEVRNKFKLKAILLRLELLKYSLY